MEMDWETSALPKRHELIVALPKLLIASTKWVRSAAEKAAVFNERIFLRTIESLLWPASNQNSNNGSPPAIVSASNVLGQLARSLDVAGDASGNLPTTTTTTTGAKLRVTLPHRYLRYSDVISTFTVIGFFCTMRSHCVYSNMMESFSGHYIFIGIMFCCRGVLLVPYIHL